MLYQVRRGCAVPGAEVRHGMYQVVTHFKSLALQLALQKTACHPVEPVRGPVDGAAVYCTGQLYCLCSIQRTRACAHAHTWHPCIPWVSERGSQGGAAGARRRLVRARPRGGAGK